MVLTWKRMQIANWIKLRLCKRQIYCRFRCHIKAQTSKNFFSRPCSWARFSLRRRELQRRSYERTLAAQEYKPPRRWLATQNKPKKARKEGGTPQLREPKTTKNHWTCGKRAWTPWLSTPTAKLKRWQSFHPKMTNKPSYHGGVEGVRGEIWKSVIT